jgi:hypothetical protein
MPLLDIKLLDRYKVDRVGGATANGPEQLVVLVVKPKDGPELAVAISKVDAMIIAHQLTLAARDAQIG